MRTTAGLCLILIFLAVADTTVAADFADKGVTLTTGLEYQLISQHYYDAILDTTSLDVIETWQLAKDEIDDIIFRTNLQYRYSSSSRRFNTLSDIELSRDRLIGRAEASYSLGSHDNYTKLFGRYENKSVFESDSNGGDLGYNHVEGYLKGRRRLSDRISLGLRAGSEFIFFEDIPVAAVTDTSLSRDFRAFGTFDYSISGAHLEGDIRLGDFGNSLYWDLAFNHRSVPDSSLADYDQWRGSLDFNSFSAAGYIMLGAYLEFKDYQQPERKDDYTALSFQARLSQDISPRFRLLNFALLDYYAFRMPDLVNRDYMRLRNDLRPSIQVGNAAFGPLALLEWYEESGYFDGGLGLSEDGDYFQWSLGGHAECIGNGGFYLSGEVSAGLRQFSEQSAIQTSYRLLNVSLIANGGLYKSISCNLMFDGTFERHDAREDNLDIYLLSFSVNIRL